MKIYMRAWLRGARRGRQGQLENLELSWEGIENANEKEDFTRLVRKKESLDEYKRERYVKERVRMQ